MNITRTQFVIASGIVLAAAVALYAMGHPLICKCGSVKLWHFDVVSSENSQHIFDWYTPSHIIHGFLFYFVFWLIAPRSSFGTRLILALLVEASWEVIENTDFVIDRYREANGRARLLWRQRAELGERHAVHDRRLRAGVARMPVWLTVLIAVAMEVFTGIMIRDGLALNVLMLLWPSETVLQWQNNR